jgi:integrase/recombinase XerD
MARRSRNQPPIWRGVKGRGGHECQADGLDSHDPHGMARSYADYLTSLEVRNFSPLTVNNRRLALIAFLRWCQERDLARPQDVTRTILESYQHWMYRHRKANGNPLGSTTQRGRLVAIKDYFRWLCRQNVILHNPASELEMPRGERRLPKGCLSESEIERVIAVPDLTQPLGVRDRAILETLYSTGIRRIEVVRLALGDLHVERRVLFIRQGKGKKDRVVPIGERALFWIGKYLAEVRPEMLLDPREQALFLSGYGDSAMSADYLSRLVSQYVRAAGIAHGGCHLFRHSCATLMLENGADIRFIQQMLGHANLSTTQIYTEVSIQQLQRIHAMTHPAGRHLPAEPKAGTLEL